MSVAPIDPAALNRACAVLLSDIAPAMTAGLLAQGIDARPDGFHADFIAAHPVSAHDLPLLADAMRARLSPDALVAGVPTAQLQHFSLLQVSAAELADGRACQRIQGMCWPSAEAQADGLARREEAARRDHRVLGARGGLFHFHPAAPGAVFWQPRGWILFRLLLDVMRARQTAAGYVEVNTPDVMDRALWAQSGHWENFSEHMFALATEDGRLSALKPMSCPGAMLMYRHVPHSYRDLPLRMAEFGKVHRYEPSGSLHGLMRVRHFTQDDAHVFCMPEQLADECRALVGLLLSIYRLFGFDEVAIKLSTRPARRMGSEAMWDELESVLAGTLEQLALPYAVSTGEGAFYGPKLEFALRDAIGREWQCGTLQVDLTLPERFDLHYVAADGSKARPVMLHRAIFGSLERFIGILLEHHAGALPAWLSPEQVRVLPVSQHQAEAAARVVQRLQARGVRASADDRGEKLGYRIREGVCDRVPYLLVVGEREAASGEVAVRARDGDLQGVMMPEDFLATAALSLPAC